MCGIVGIAGEVDRNLLKKMNEIIKHRGPDDSGLFLDNNIGLGNRRLSIIDVAGGKQPIHNEDQSIWITFNGEIYNFLKLKKNLKEKGHKFYTNTDTEVIVHLYEEFGEDCVKKLRGMFAFAIWDAKKKKLFLARDRLGIKPLYYTIINNDFLFGSEIKSIIQDSRIKRKINLRALHYFLTLRYTPGPDTMFEGIYKLQPGHTLSWDGKLKIKRYWKLEMNPSNKSEKYYLNKFYEIFKESIKMRLKSEVPLGAYLSGGIDSSSVVAMMSEVMKEPVKTFSVGFGEERTDETKYSRFVADYFGTDHHEFMVELNEIDLFPKIVWYFDEPVADPAAIPIYLLSKLAKNNVTVVLMGEGGDELFAGYEQYKIICNAERYIKFIPETIKSNFISKIPILTPKKFLDYFFKYSSSLGKEGIRRASECINNVDKDVLQSYLEIVSIFDEKELKKLHSRKNRKNTKNISIRKKYWPYFQNVVKKNRLNSLILLETEVQLPDNLLMKNDKMTMACSLESRFPFLDHELIEFGAKLPQNLKLKGMKDKYLLRKVMSRLVPELIMKRKKHRFFVPIDTWLKEELGEIFKQMFSKENVKKVGLFDYNYIDYMMKNLKSSKLYYSRQIWNLLTFEIWRRIFIEPENVERAKLSLNKLLI